MATITPGQNWQTATTNNPAGTTFVITGDASTPHIQQSVIPKAGNTYISTTGAVMDGQDVTQYAFNRSSTLPSNVTIKGLRITQYNPASQQGAILGGGDSAAQSTSGWLIEDTEVDNCSNCGIRMGNSMTMRRVNLHHNDLLGAGGLGDDIILEDSEIAFNNPVNPSGNERGGIKFVLTNRLICRRNWFHHNRGQGIWPDIGNRDFVIEDNLSEYNQREGIQVEISYNGIIRRNHLRRNGFGDTRSTSFPWGAGIGIHSSGGTGIEVYENLVDGNIYGISLIQQDRGTNFADPVGVDALMFVQNVDVHDNIIVMQATPTGSSLGSSCVAADNGDTLLYTSRNNHFTANKYFFHLPVVTNPFAWNGAFRNFASWQTFGHDAGMSVTQFLARYHPGDA